MVDARMIGNAPGGLASFSRTPGALPHACMCFLTPSHVEWPEMEDCWQQVTCSVFHDTQPLEMSLTNPQRELDKWPLNVQMEQPWW